jgi:3',5'-cyclic-AMP phosphodiesterase
MGLMTSPLRLLQFSDTHLMSDPLGELKGVRSFDSLRLVLAHARQRHWNAEALLLTGDLVHDDAAAYTHIRAQFGALGKPVHCLPGNHDDVPAMHRALQGAPFTTAGLVDFAHWRIVMLDSVVSGEAHGALAPAELARLEQALAGAGERQVMVCLHHHPVQMASRWLDTVKLQNSSDFFGVVDRFKNVRAISWGHVHQQFDVRRKGVRLLAVPSTCAQFTPYSDNFAVDSQSHPGYRRFALHADGNIETEIVRVDLHAAALRAAG